MSKLDKNNDPLESFFRNKLDDYDIPYDEQDWQMIKEKLDLADKKLAYGNQMKWMTAAAVLLFSLLGYFIFENYSSISRINEQLANETELPKNNASGKTVTPGIKNRPAKQNQEGENDHLGNASKQGDTNIAINAANQPGKATAYKDNISEQAAVAKMVDVQRVATINCVECARIAPDIESVSLAYASENMIPRVVDNSDSRFTSGEGSRNNTSAAVQPRAFSRIELGAVFGPDLSTAGTVSNFENPGYKIGLRVDVRLNSRLAVSTGAVYSNVRYVAGRGEYTPTYEPNGIIASETFAECALIDIPLTLKYDLFHLPKSSVFASGGLSSYIMLNENYQFRYQDQYGETSREWSTQTGTLHLFSNANFSVGYKRALNQNWGIQIEPFINVPLRGVGVGKVNLYSLGTLFSFNYSLQ